MSFHRVLFVISLFSFLHLFPAHLYAQENNGGFGVVGIGATVLPTKYNSIQKPEWEKYWDTLDSYTQILYVSSSGFVVLLVAGVLIAHQHRR